MASIYLLCGQIASGKTTYAQLLKQKEPAIILSCDDLMLTLFDSCLGPRHDEVYHKCSDYFYQLALQIIETNVSVILDLGYWTAAQRLHAKNFFKERGLIPKLYYFDVPYQQRMAQLKERNALLHHSTTRVYIIESELLERLDAKFEKPTPNEVDVLIHSFEKS